MTISDGICYQVWQEDEETPGLPPELLSASEKGQQVWMYGSNLEMWHRAVRWSWVEPDGQKWWDQDMLIKECHEGRVGGHLGAP